MPDITSRVDAARGTKFMSVFQAQGVVSAEFTARR